MARYYSPVKKETFLEKVRALMEDGDGLFENLSETIKRDIAKVDFEHANPTTFKSKQGHGHGTSLYPVGYEELHDGFHIFYVNAGGTKHHPLCFILYWCEKELRGYIPRKGNVYNKKEKVAHNKNEVKLFEEEFSLELMRKDILSRIHKPPVDKSEE